MLERLRAFIHTHNLLSPNDTLILAVSGGLDSMVMLDLFLHLDDVVKAKPAVIHINHGLRGSDSDTDEHLVRDICLHNGLDFYSDRLTNLSENANEDVMRQARYKAFEKILALHFNAKLATAHHLDDQFETFLMRLAKGTSLKGLGSIPEKRSAYIRPMLGFHRAELEKYAQEHQISYRVDATNQDISKLRNHIRKNIVPNIIEVFGDSFYAGFDKTLSELKSRQKNLADDNERLFKTLFKVKQGNGSLALEDYNDLPDLQKRDLFQYCVSHLDPLNYLASNEMWQSFDRFVAQAKTGTQFLISKKIKVYKNRTTLLFTISSDKEWPARELFPDSSVDWGNRRIKLQEVSRKQVEFRNDPNREFFCGDKVTFPIQVRSWKNGDVFRPLGMRGTKKLSDFLIDFKIDRNKKMSIPIITNGSKIIWIAGYRLDDRFKVTEHCKKIFEIDLTKEA